MPMAIVNVRARLASSGPSGGRGPGGFSESLPSASNPPASSSGTVLDVSAGKGLESMRNSLRMGENKKDEKARNGPVMGCALALALALAAAEDTERVRRDASSYMVRR